MNRCSTPDQSLRTGVMVLERRVTAYMDMEFGGICGTWQRMKLPVEAGVVIHDPGSDTLSFAGKKFSFDLDVTVWKNITDELGQTVGKNPCTINPARNLV
jgi:hypothetical protein